MAYAAVLDVNVYHKVAISAGGDRLRAHPLQQTLSRVK